MTQPFEALHLDVRRWVWDKGWGALKPIQGDTIDAWTRTDSDILIEASTAGGKTEAAFLPVISTLAEHRTVGSFGAIYVGPLKALINDQFERLEDLCRDIDIPVHRWHGDVSNDKKRKAREHPSGVLLITPESLEALVMLRGREAGRFFSNVRAVIIDELHVFLESERGRQLATLLGRAFGSPGVPRPRRIGLSATLGDSRVALDWVARGSTHTPTHVKGESDSRGSIVSTCAIEVGAEVKSKVEALNSGKSQGSEEEPEGSLAGLEFARLVGYRLLSELNRGTNLVFCNSRNMIEEIADQVRELTTMTPYQRRFLVHHGSLSRELRYDTENALRGNDRELTVVCSSTLELGINIGHCDAVGQVGAPHSVSAMLQRLGRSGRSDGAVPKMRIYIRTNVDSANSSLSMRLEGQLLKVAALCNLRRMGWIEPPFMQRADLSTAAQQILSSIRQLGGATAATIFELISSGNAFPNVTPEVFVEMLRDLGRANAIDQVPTGEIVLGPKGESLTAHFDFYAAFTSEDEWEVRSGRDRIGLIPANPGYVVEGYLLLAGRRWRIVAVESDRKVITVVRARGKGPLITPPSLGETHWRVRQEMMGILWSDQDIPEFDATASECLRRVRKFAREAGLKEGRVVRSGEERFLVVSGGSRGLRTLQLVLRDAGLSVSAWPEHEFELGLCLGKADCSADAKKALSRFVATDVDPVELVLNQYGGNPPECGKFNYLYGSRLKAQAYVSELLDVIEARQIAEKLL